LTFDAQLGITGYGYAPGGIDPDGLGWTGAYGGDERDAGRHFGAGREILKTFPLSV